MSSDNAKNLSELIRESAEDVQSMTVDGVSHTNRSITDMIKADQYLKSQEAAKDVIGSSMRVAKIKGRSAR